MLSTYKRNTYSPNDFAKKDRIYHRIGWFYLGKNDELGSEMAIFRYVFTS